MNEEKCALNTDLEIWRQIPDDYYSPSIHVNEAGGIGMNLGGTVYVLPIEEWFALARERAKQFEPREDSSPRQPEGGIEFAEAKLRKELLCPPHASLDENGHLESFDNCIACIRVERDELRQLLLRISTDIGQTIIEDPIKSADGWTLLSKPVLADIAAQGFSFPALPGRKIMMNSREYSAQCKTHGT